MFYIKHNSDNFTIIDCCLSEENKKRIVDEIQSASAGKGVTRFISTHPDDDHFRGLEYLDDNIGIKNFYCVKNTATKLEITPEFEYYCELRNSQKAFHIFEGCTRKWMNLDDDERKSSGIDIIWPDVNNPHFVEQLQAAEQGESPNNISAAIQYSMRGGVSALWMGDMETDFMEEIAEAVGWPQVDILFAPHHGRDSGKVPNEILNILRPKIIVLGEAPSRHLNYYGGYKTLTQNSTGDIVFDCVAGKVHVFVENFGYKVDYLGHEAASFPDMNYIGTLDLNR